MTSTFESKQRIRMNKGIFQYAAAGKILLKEVSFP